MSHPIKSTNLPCPFALENILGCLGAADLKKASRVNKIFYENAYAVVCKNRSASIQFIINRTLHISNFLGISATRFFGAISQGTILLSVKELTNIHFLGNLRFISPKRICVPDATCALSKIDIENLLKFFPYLSHLSLKNSSAHPSDLRTLLPNLKNSRLTSLSLKGFKISIKIYSQLPAGLTKLELTQCLLGPRALCPLTSYKIHSLNLKKSGVSQNTLTEIEKVNSLQCLNIEENYEIGFKNLVQFLKRKPLKSIAYGSPEGDIYSYLCLRKLFPNLEVFQTNVLRRRYSI